MTNKEIKEALQQEGMPMLRTMKGNLVLYLPVGSTDRYKPIAETWHRKWIILDDIEVLGNKAFDVLKLLNKWDHKN